MPAPSPAPRRAAPIRLLIVDDSVVVRSLLSRWLAAEPDIELAGQAVNGREGVRMAEELKPDVIVLDVEMPELDGIGAIPEILRKAPGARILMASTLTRRNAEITLKALALGASDYLAKPESGAIAAAVDFRRDILDRVRALGARRPHAAPEAQARAIPNAAGKLRPPLSDIFTKPPEILVIGSSTGGPQALGALIGAIGGRIAAPILVVQHMPPMFTAILSEHLSKVSPAPTAEARQGEPIRPGSVYVAPGDHHMRIVRRFGALTIALDQSPPVNFCRPAVDPLFQSAAETHPRGALGVVLTGMGADGRKGAEAIAAAGGAVIVQDEATSVVWGMPGAVANAGLASMVAPIKDLAPAIVAAFQGRRR